jgi:hypothetical protein
MLHEKEKVKETPVDEQRKKEVGCEGGEDAKHKTTRKGKET